jgi:hypothetical protein
MQAIAERRARPNAKRFDRPYRYRDGPVFLHHFPALRTGLLSLSPFLLRFAARPSYCGRAVARRAKAAPGYGGQAGTSPQCTILNSLS